jgi:TENA/THI-4/PQQC family
VRPQLELQLAHPVVRGIGDGTLDEGRFRRWLVQDYLFLLDYVCLFALAAARAPDAGTLGRLVDLAHATFHDELSLHRAYAARFRISEQDLETAAKSPVCAAYTDFLLRTAGGGAAGRAALPAVGRDLRRPRVRRAGRLVRRAAGPGRRRPAARARRRLRARVPHQPGPRAGVLGRLTGRVRAARRR